MEGEGQSHWRVGRQRLILVVVRCGCVVVWLCGCVVVWLCGCVVVWLCGCVVVWLRTFYLFCRAEHPTHGDICPLFNARTNAKLLPPSSADIPPCTVDVSAA
jgi:hypothetical protein